MNKLTEKHLIALNEKIAKQNGDIPSVEDAEKLKKIVEKPYEKNEEFFYIHKNKIDKASVLGVELVNGKPFANNNVATATLAIFTFLELNGKKLVVKQEDIYSLQDLMKEGDILKVNDWIKSHV